MTIGVDTLPPLPKHAGDRNRTSPFAFTGNRFEFRAVGSSQSIAGPLVVLNTILAESLDHIATELEQATGGDMSKLNAAVQKMLAAGLSRTTRPWSSTATAIRKNGTRKPRNAACRTCATRSTPCPCCSSRKSRRCSRSTACFTAREVHSRYEIYMERYCKDVNTEALTALTMAKTLILPAASRYQAELAKDAAALKAVGKPAPATLDTVSTLVGQLEERIGKLAAAMDHHGSKDVLRRGQALPRRRDAGHAGRARRLPISSRKRSPTTSGRCPAIAKCCSSSKVVPGSARPA